MTQTHDAAVASATAAAAGVGYLGLGGDYWVLATAGAIIGMIHWFYAWSHADRAWSRAESMSEALKSTLFGLVIMPAAIDASGPFLERYGVGSPSVKILVGAVAAFSAVELFALGMRFLRGRAGA